MNWIIIMIIAVAICALLPIIISGLVTVFGKIGQWIAPVVRRMRNGTNSKIKKIFTGVAMILSAAMFIFVIIVSFKECSHSIVNSDTEYINDAHRPDKF